MSKKAIAIATVAIVAGVIIFLPQILSTTVGKRFFIHTIEAKIGGTAEIDSLQLSWLGPQKASGIVLQAPEMQGQIESVQADIPIWKFGDLLKVENLLKLKGNLSLQGGSFQFDSASITDISASFRIHEGAADFVATGKSSVGGEGGSFSLEGHLGAKMDFSVRGEVVKFPAIALGRYLGMGGKVLSEIVGGSFSLKGFITMQRQKGSCDLSLHAPNGDAEIRGNLNDNVFILTDPLRATIRLTPLLAERVLSGVNPLFVTGIAAESPILLRIETRQFRFFLGRPFQWSNLQIGGGMLDMGKIRCTNGSTLGALIGMLKNSPLSGTKEMTVWFTPLFFKLENGLLQTGRMDALAAKSVRFCTWGNVDLVKNRLDMTLGLTSETLQRAFGLKQVSDSYVLKIPITGSIQDPKLAVSAGAAKIAALLAAQHAPKGAGGLLNLFLQPDSDIPKPNKPFPWDQ